VPKVLKMPKVLEVVVLSDQITPLTLGTLSTSSILGTLLVSGRNPRWWLKSLKLRHDIRSSELTTFILLGNRKEIFLFDYRLRS
jgi:hypothetical protein